MTGDRARFRKTPKSWRERAQHTASEHLVRLTLFLSLPAARIVQSLRFMLPFLFHSHASRARDWDESIIWWFNVGFASIEMPSMVSVFWWLSAGQVDKIAVLFTRAFGLTSFRGKLCADIFVLEFRSSRVCCVKTSSVMRSRKREKFGEIFLDDSANEWRCWRPVLIGKLVINR